MPFLSKKAFFNRIFSVEEVVEVGEDYTDQVGIYEGVEGVRKIRVEWQPMPWTFNAPPGV